MHLPDLLKASCQGRAFCLSQRTGVAAIDTAMTIVVVIVGWVLLWCSQRPLDVLVVLIGKATCGFKADRHSLPRHVQGACFARALMPHGDGIDRVHPNWWSPYLRPLQLVMASLPVVACRDYQLCIAVTMSRLQLCFLTSLLTKRGNHHSIIDSFYLLLYTQ